MEVGKREITSLSLHCHHRNDSCIRTGSDASFSWGRCSYIETGFIHSKHRIILCGFNRRTVGSRFCFHAFGVNFTNAE